MEQRVRVLIYFLIFILPLPNPVSRQIEVQAQSILHQSFLIFIPVVGRSSFRKRHKNSSTSSSRKVQESSSISSQFLHSRSVRNILCCSLSSARAKEREVRLKLSCIAGGDAQQKYFQHLSNFERQRCRLFLRLHGPRESEMRSRRSQRIADQTL